MAVTPPTVMTFAATDPSSGAGVQADIMALSSIGCYPLSVITGITVARHGGCRKRDGFGCRLD